MWIISQDSYHFKNEAENGYKVSVWDDENVLNLDFYEGHITQ